MKEEVLLASKVTVQDINERLTNPNATWFYYGNAKELAGYVTLTAKSKRAITDSRFKMNPVINNCSC